MTHSPNDPNRQSESNLIAIAYGWATRIMTVAMEMVVPGLIGVWLDDRLGTKIVFVLIGFGGGCSLAVWHLIRMTKADAGVQIAGAKDGRAKGASAEAKGNAAKRADETLEDK